MQSSLFKNCDKTQICARGIWPRTGKTELASITNVQFHLSVQPQITRA